MKKIKATAGTSGKAALDFGDRPKKTKLKPVKKSKNRNSFFDDEDEDFFSNVEEDDSWTEPESDDSDDLY